MQKKEQLKIYLKKNKEGNLNGSMSSYLMQDVLETAIACMEEKEILIKHWLDLCDKILAEHDKDGWCRLTMSKEEALKMKELFQSL